VFDRGLARVDHVGQRQGDRSVAHQWEPDLLAGRDQRVVVLACEARVRLQEVVARVLLRLRDRVRFVGIRELDAAGPHRGLAVDDRSGRVDARADQRAGFDARAPIEVKRRAEHVAHRGHAVRDEQVEVVLVPHVHVHVGEAGHQETLAAIDARRAVGDGDFRGRAERGDAPVDDDHGLIGEHDLAVHRDHRDVFDRERGFGGGTEAGAARR
jgi:hypothetical protein